MLDLLSITSTRMQARAFGSGFSFLAASEVHFGEREKNEKQPAAKLLEACIQVKHPLQETWAAPRPTNSP